MLYCFFVGIVWRIKVGQTAYSSHASELLIPFDLPTC